MTARDLARYALLFVRGGRGVGGQQVGSRAFIETTRARKGVPYAARATGSDTANHTVTDGQCLGHGGYGGQYMLANPDTGVVVVFFSVLENADAYDAGVLGRGDPDGGGDHPAPGVGAPVAPRVESETSRSATPAA